MSWFRKLKGEKTSAEIEEEAGVVETTKVEAQQELRKHASEINKLWKVAEQHRLRLDELDAAVDLHLGGRE